MNRNYTLGRAFEYKRKKFWESIGWTVVRSAGSHSFADLVLLHPEVAPVTVQCKRCTSEAEAKRLCKAFKAATTPTKYYGQLLECWVVGQNKIIDEFVDCEVS